MKKVYKRVSKDRDTRTPRTPKFKRYIGNYGGGYISV
jgi:hypothetical protein